MSFSGQGFRGLIKTFCLSCKLSRSEFLQDNDFKAMGKGVRDMGYIFNECILWSCFSLISWITWYFTTDFGELAKSMFLLMENFSESGSSYFI